MVLRWTWFKNLFFTIQLVFFCVFSTFPAHMLGCAVKSFTGWRGSLGGFFSPACCKRSPKLYYKWRVIKANFTRVQEFIWVLIYAWPACTHTPLSGPYILASLLFKRFALAQRLAQGVLEVTRTQTLEREEVEKSKGVGKGVIKLRSEGRWLIRWKKWKCRE